MLWVSIVSPSFFGVQVYQRLESHSVTPSPLCGRRNTVEIICFGLFLPPPGEGERKLAICDVYPSTPSKSIRHPLGDRGQLSQRVCPKRIITDPKLAAVPSGRSLDLRMTCIAAIACLAPPFLMCVASHLSQLSMMAWFSHKTSVGDQLIARRKPIVQWDSLFECIPWTTQ